MIVKIYNENPSPKIISQVVDILKDGGIVIYPTDTVYAMGCDAMNVRAAEKLCKLKDINPNKALFSLICHDLSHVSQYVKISNDTFKLMKKNLPGSFTFIVPCISSLPKLYKNRKNVGIRIPNNNIITEIVKELGNPIFTTSVKIHNDSSEYTTDPELIHEAYEKDVDLVIDGGIGGTEFSTLVDCTGNKIEILREGIGVLEY